MNNIFSDNAVILISAFLFFVVILFRKEIAERIKNVKLDPNLLFKFDMFVKVAEKFLGDVKYVENAWSDQKITPEEMKEIVGRITAYKTQIEDLLK